MISAILEYRTHVPFGWIAIEFCDLKFYGENTEELDHEWARIEYDKCDRVKPKIKEILARISSIDSEISILEGRKLVSYNPIKRFKARKHNKSIADSICELSRERQKLEEDKEELKDDRFYDALTLKYKARDFLSANGFRLINKSSHGDVCVTYSEVWEREDSKNNDSDKKTNDKDVASHGLFG